MYGIRRKRRRLSMNSTKGSEMAVGRSTNPRAHYDKEGYFYPLSAFEEPAAASLLAELDQLEASAGADLWQRTRIKPYLHLTALNRLMRNPRILDAVEAILGPNILVWAMARFNKP